MSDISDYKKTAAQNHSVGDQVWSKESFEEGFDSCMNLELPVRFGEYIKVNWQFIKGRWYHNGDFFQQDKTNRTVKDIFDNWLKNIWKSPE